MTSEHWWKQNPGWHQQALKAFPRAAGGSRGDQDAGQKQGEAGARSPVCHYWIVLSLVALRGNDTMSLTKPLVHAGRGSSTRQPFTMGNSLCTGCHCSPISQGNWLDLYREFHLSDKPHPVSSHRLSKAYLAFCTRCIVNIDQRFDIPASLPVNPNIECWCLPPFNANSCPVLFRTLHGGTEHIFKE